jgi:hypothetical protein
VVADPGVLEVYVVWKPGGIYQHIFTEAGHSLQVRYVCIERRMLIGK